MNEDKSDVETKTILQGSAASTATQPSEGNETSGDFSVSPRKNQKPSTNKSTTDNYRSDETCRIQKTVFEMKRGRDEYDLFGEQIAYKLRKLQNDRVRSNVQHIINTVLWEAALGRYDNYEASFSISHV